MLYALHVNSRSKKKAVFSLLVLASAEKNSFCQTSLRVETTYTSISLVTTNLISYKVACIELVSFKAVSNPNDKVANLLFTRFNSVFER